MARKIQDACSEMTMSLRRNLTRSRYGCQTRGPRRFCSLAFQFRMQPVSNGARARSRSVCNRIAKAFMGRQGRKAETRNPKPEGNPNARNPKADGPRGASTRAWSALHPTPDTPFGFRLSDFGLPSVFELRVSDFPRS